MTERLQRERQELLEQVKALREDGKTIRQIASELGVHRSSVHRAVKALAQRGARETALSSPLTNGGMRGVEESHPKRSLTDGAFVGRGPEMEQLRSALEESMSGRPHLMMLVGEPGIGKTRISQELAGYAQSRGARVLRGRCYESMGTPPYWPWVQAIQSYVRDCDPERLRFEMGAGAADIADIVPDLRAKLPGLEPSAGLEPEQARMRLFDSIVTFLKTAAQTQPQVLVLDNLHWADISSLLLLEFMSQELGEARILTIGTYRDTEVSREHPLSRTLGELTKGRHFYRLPLSGLTSEDVGTLIEVMSGATPSQSLAQQVHGRTGGNPLFVTEVVRLLASEMAAKADFNRDPTQVSAESRIAKIPEGVREAIGTRLYRMSEECNRALTVASVVGREFGLEPLKRLLPEFTEDRLLEALDEALSARVIEEMPGAVGRYQFSHALIQETVYSEMSSARRARLHASIAETLEMLYGDDAADHAAELVHHLIQANSLLNRDKLVRYSLLAGERASASFAWEDAQTHYRRALATKGVNLAGAEPASDRIAADLLFGLGRAQVAMGESTQMNEAAISFVRSFDQYVSSGNVEQALAVAEYQRPPIPGYVTGAGQLITRALDLVPADSLQAGRLQASYSRVMGLEEGNYEAAKQAYGIALDIAKQNGDADLELQILSIACDVDGYHLNWQGALDKGLRAVELASLIDNPRAELLARVWCCYPLAMAGDLKGAESHATAMLVLAKRFRLHYYESRAYGAAGMVSRAAGDFDTELRFTGQGLTIAPRDPRLLCRRTILAYELGNFEEGDAYLERSLEVARQSAPGPNFERAFSAIAIAEGIRITGVTDLADTAEEFSKTILASPTSTPIVTIFARFSSSLLCTYQKDSIAAAEQYTALSGSRGVEWGWMFGFPTGRTLGLLAHTVGRMDEAVAHFEDGLAFCRNAGFRPALAWTCHDYVEALLDPSSIPDPSMFPVSGRDSGRTVEGSRIKVMSLLNEALEISRELGMRPLTDKVVALQELAEVQLGPGPIYPDGLTVREVEVLCLVASGLSNREIAAELVLSTRTVERHITNIYGKIGARGRADATSYALGHELLDGK